MKAVTTCLALLVFVGCDQSGPQVPASRPAWGPAVNGLRIGIAPAEPDSSGTLRFHVTLENVGDAGYFLDLGMVLANGYGPMWPSAVRLLLAEENGATRELRFADGPVAGRMDALLVCMRAGSTHSLLLSIDEFWSPGTNEFRLQLKNGAYRISASFLGRAVEQTNLDMVGLTVLKFWTGTVQSRELEFRVGSRPPARR